MIVLICLGVIIGLMLLYLFLESSKAKSRLLTFLIPLLSCIILYLTLENSKLYQELLQKEYPYREMYYNQIEEDIVLAEGMNQYIKVIQGENQYFKAQNVEYERELALLKQKLLLTKQELLSKEEYLYKEMYYKCEAEKTRDEAIWVEKLISKNKEIENLEKTISEMKGE